MQCKYPGCEGVADYPYPCCSINHGVKFKEELGLVKSKQANDLTPWGESQYSELSKEKIDYYLKLI